MAKYPNLLGENGVPKSQWQDKRIPTPKWDENRNRNLIFGFERKKEKKGETDQKPNTQTPFTNQNRKQLIFFIDFDYFDSKNRFKLSINRYF